MDLALALMILTVIGSVLHSTGFIFLADVIFTVVGTIGNFLKNVAEKIGLAEWSTVSIHHKYFTYFCHLNLHNKKITLYE